MIEVEAYSPAGDASWRWKAMIRVGGTYKVLAESEGPFTQAGDAIKAGEDSIISAFQTVLYNGLRA